MLQADSTSFCSWSKFRFHFMRLFNNKTTDCYWYFWMAVNFKRDGQIMKIPSSWRVRSGIQMTLPSQLYYCSMPVSLLAGPYCPSGWTQFLSSVLYYILVPEPGARCIRGLCNYGRSNSKHSTSHSNSRPQATKPGKWTWNGYHLSLQNKRNKTKRWRL